MISNITPRQRFAAAILRRYPFYSGCARVANHRITRRLTGSSNADVWAPCYGSEVLCNLGDFNGRLAFYLGGVDPKIAWVVRRFTKPGDICIDAGANLGLVSLLMAQRVGHAGRVHSFEPNPTLAGGLQQTIARNQLHHVTLHPSGLGSAPATLTLNIPVNHTGGASLARTIVGPATAVEVPVTTIDALNLDRIDFVKLDVEGFELNVLQGMTQTLDRTQPRAILFELNNPDPASDEWAIFTFLAQRGYRFHAIPRRLMRMTLIPFDPDKPPTQTPYHDFVATR